MKTILYFLVTALLIWAAATYGGESIGITISGDNTFVSAFIFAVILSIVNVVIGTILRIITFPINFLTFGLISGLITIFMIYITDSFYSSIEIFNFVGYLIIAFIPSVSAMLLRKK